MIGKRRFLFRLLTVVGGLVAGLLLGEVVLRVIGFRYLNLNQADQHVGFTLRPGAEGWWRREGEAYIRINSDGLRDREHTREKPPNTYRIAILGDSYSEALQVPMEKAFWAVMEERLRGCAALGGRHAEVINFGVSGYSTAQELITFRQRVWQYSPDLVLLVVTTSNDIRDNSRILSQKYAGLPLPYFVYQNGELVLEDSILRARNESLKFRLQQTFFGRSLDWLRNKSRMVGLIDNTRVAFQDFRESRGSRGLGNEPGLTPQIYLAPTAPAWNDAWLVTEGLMRQMRDEVNEHGARFLIVTGSSGIQANPDSNARLNFMRSLGVNDLFYPDYRIRALGEREGIEVLTLAPMLQDYAVQNGVYLHGVNGVGHWNALGHRLVGERVAGRICEMATASR